MSPSEVGLTGLVGRSAELAGLRATLAEAASGRGSSVLVSGEAGIGKSRLVGELADLARDCGTAVLCGRCIELVGPSVPYFALLEALRSAPAPARPVAEPAALPRYDQDGTGPRLDELADARPSAEVQRRVFEEMRDTLDAVAASAPVLLVVEDLHWADASTLDAVAFLSRAIRDRRILVVATYRSDEVRPGDPLARLAVELVRARDARAVELSPLGPDALRSLVEGAAGRSLPGDLIEAIIARSGGNPFFAEELLAAADRGERALPALLRDALLQRVARIDPEGQAVLRIAAAFGGDVPYRLLAALTLFPAVHRPEPQLTEGHLDAALRQAVEHGVLVPDRAVGAYRFRHPLLAEAVYATVLPGEAERLHERLAHALAKEPGLGGERAVAGELARHWSAAGRPVQAFAASVRAARDAEAVYGLAEALRHLERVLVLWPQVPLAEEVTGTDQAAVLAWAAELADLTGRGHRAVDLVRRAIELVGARPASAIIGARPASAIIGARPASAIIEARPASAIIEARPASAIIEARPASAIVKRGPDRIRAGLLHERLGSYLLPIGDRTAALAACVRATDLVPPRPPSAERARVLTSLGNALMLSWRHADSLPVCEEALATAAAIGDPRPALRAEGILGIDLCYLGRPEEARDRLLAARERALQCGTPRDVAHSHAALCEVLLATGQPREAAQVARYGLGLARDLGVDLSFGALLAAYGAEACLATGDWDEAEELLADAHRSGTAFWAHYPRLLHAWLAIARGDLAAAREHLAAGAQGERQPTSSTRHAWVVAELALWEGRPDAAASAVEAGLTGSDAGRSPVHRVRFAALGLRAHAECAQLAAVRRDQPALDAARRRARQLLTLARRAASEAAGVTPEAAAWRALAEAEHARVRQTPEADRWRAAVAAWDELDRPYLAAYCRWRLVEALLTGGTAQSLPASPPAPSPPGRPALLVPVPAPAGEAVRAAREAHRVAGALGAAPLRREIELLAERGRLDLIGLPPAGQPGPIDALGLTAREGQVLRLLTRGYTNREIAVELTISVKTASVHVSHILHKLGVSRRIDAAAIAHRLDVPSQRRHDPVT